VLYYWHMTQSVARQFHAALTHLLSEEGRGAQTRLATAQQIDRGYLNAIVKQRKPGSDKIREKIADHFNMTFEDILSLGRLILSGEDVSTWRISKSVGMVPRQPQVGEQTKKIGQFEPTPKQETASSNIPDKIVKAIEILSTGSGYDNLLSDLIDVFYDTISTKNENEALKIKLREFEARLAILENQSDSEKELLQKTA
jgi:hypothetical protein